MSKPQLLLLLLHLTLLCIPLLLLQICSGVSLDSPRTTPQIDVLAKRVCNSTIEDCLTDPETDSETTRRVLVMQKKYISYDTLRRDMVPCEKSGASYYECHASQANPYGRGCSTITRCRGT